MKLGIMQPYFFPYLGYFQLIHAVDKFVLHDDVQWIKGGWINRNRILVNGKDQLINLPLRKDSSLLNINQRYLADDADSHKQKMIRQFRDAYRKAPFFGDVFPLFERCMLDPETNMAVFTANTIHACCHYLGINTPVLFSSAIEKDNDLRGQARVLDINLRLGANHYINPIGGTALYDREVFASKGIRLDFLRTRAIRYPQFQYEHVAFLSILDVMVFNAPEQIVSLLDAYDLVQN
jgi:hypothetical protein